jgi:eukaryotic-like serine/threonine-protein kinase
MAFPLMDDGTGGPGRSRGDGALPPHPYTPECPHCQLLRLPPVGASPIALDPFSGMIGVELDGRYRLEAPLAHGAMAGVYRATQLRTGDQVAIKVLSYSDDDPVALRRFRREAEITSSLRHPNIVAVLDFGSTPEGIYFIVMELLEGEVLAALLRERERLDAALTLHITLQCVAALATVHDAGIIHRDLKPTNVFLSGEPPCVKLLDFGMSKLDESQSALTGKSAILGSMGYMSPEQAAGRSSEVDRRSDVYALAALTYRMLTGRAPFTGKSLGEICEAVIKGELVPPSRLTPLPAAVDGVLCKALAKRPDDRHPDMQAFGRELQAAFAR